jgi:hypothetical protein
MPAPTILTETYPARLRREAAYARGRARLRPLIIALHRQMTTREELLEYRQFLQTPANLERAQRERAGQVLWFLWVMICALALMFDSSFTFSSTAASLRDGLSHVLPFVSSGLDFFVALALATTVLAITTTVRISTEASQERRCLNRIAADSPEVPDLVTSIHRKRNVRAGWAAMLTVLLATAALSELLAIRAYQELAQTARATMTIANAGQENAFVSNAESYASVLALITPYTVTAVLHFLVLFLPLPSSSPFLSYPCSPDRIDATLRRVDQAIRDTGRELYDRVLTIPNESARSQLVGILGEDERGAVNRAVGRPVFQVTSTTTPVPESEGRANNARSTPGQPGTTPGDPSLPPESISEAPQATNFQGVL